MLQSKYIIRLLLSFGMVFAVSGCLRDLNGKNGDIQSPNLAEWREKAAKSKGYSPSKAKIKVDLKTDEAETTRQKVIPERPLPEAPITMKFRDVDLSVVLRTMAKSVKQNMVINDNIKGKLDLNIYNTPWNQVFKAILRSQGLGYVWEGDIIRVVALADKDQDLKQLEIEEKIASKKKELEMAEALHVRVVRINFSEAAKLKQNLETFLTKKGDTKVLGSIMVDEHTNSLIIEAISSDMEKIIGLIENLDRPTPQILIEAHIIETNKDTARQLGIQWGGLYHAGGGVGDSSNYWIAPGAAGGIGVSPGASGGVVDPASGYAVNFPAELDSDAGMTIGYIAEKVGKDILAVQLTALEEDGLLNILSSPSITTLDNQLAKIESGKEVPFQTVEDGEVSIVFKKAVLKLEVVPHVIDGATMKLKIVTHKDELDFSNTVAGNPTIITKNAETNVILFDGQTTVIGGLNKETHSDADSGVPYLKDIPYLGALFRGSSKSRNMEEVLIFITPHILKQQPEKSTVTKQ